MDKKKFHDIIKHEYAHALVLNHSELYARQNARREKFVSDIRAFDPKLAAMYENVDKTVKELREYITKVGEELLQNGAK